MASRPLIIDDSTNPDLYMTHVSEGIQRGTGYEPRDWGRCAQGATAAAPAFPDELLIPRSDWSAMIKERKERKSGFREMFTRFGYKVLDQKNTNYCWTHGPVHAIYGVRLFNRLPFQELSATAVAAVIKGYRNVGGLGIEAINYIAKNGVPTVERWPANAIDPRYNTQATKDDAATRLVTEWFDLQPRNFDQYMSCLLRFMPVCKGHDWWQHEVCGYDPEEIEPGSFGSTNINSWGTGYGEGGFFVMREGKDTPDDAQAVGVFDPTFPTAV